MTVPVAPRSVPLARTHFREWLEFLGWPQAGSDDVLLVVNEAVTNAVEHSGDVPDSVGGAEQIVEISADVEVTGVTRQLRIRVRDRGRWREPPADPGYRGHGLPMMFELMEQVVIHRGETGSEVMLLTAAVEVVP
ncbi:MULTISPECIES: ATP-binding protein [Pseudonocardia]|uniref:Histidine kinase/HSP90-like ATPase domain-containing protein n=1 Tax=Pseudonocardia saturnea TaxID=33909 RepID=A0ABQ0RZX6_9PSEU|nr:MULTISPECIES: ATP-binding protein [Pseudonocardia]BBG04059.1 hypothetical protein Pdca_52680 [Pseudonocardia autotrophica]GEC26196.1 hypothetical protein PSA01_32250 [Pseudonocardia saturnea]